MKAKYLFYSFALASAFTACTQDEIVDAPVLNNASAERPVVGVVTFANGEVDSRYNSEAAKFENGDQMGLYLMDEFRGDHEATLGELANANSTYWEWQSSWWTMFNMVDYINTNYGYVYNAETEEWINRASQLIEGNYIAMFPQNTRATNRRDLWHPINANVDLVDHSSTPRYYVNRENQFFVGYEQIMRDQKAGEETGELRADVTMKPVLTYGKMFFENQAANDFKIKKVVFKAHGGKTLPNVAYVKPAGIVRTDNHGHIAPWWAWTNNQCTAALKQTLKDECGNVLAWSKYDRNTFTHAAARSMVQYASTITGQIPYGMTDAEATPVYEYVFNFPADADILKSNQAPSEERVCGISIALPAFDFGEYDWQDMEVVVYGEMWDPTINFPEGGWRSGIVRKLLDNQNGIFTLDQLSLWTKDANMQIPSVTCRIDDQYFYQNTEVRVSTTKDLYDLIEARLSNASNTVDVNFEVQHYGNGLEITNDIVKLITDYEKDNNVNVNVRFNNVDNVDTPIIFKAENAIDEFDYVNVNVDVEAPQTITDVIVDGILSLNNFSTITIAKANTTTALQAQGIINEVGASVIVNNAIVAANINNHATLSLNGANVAGNVKNEAVMTTKGNTTVIGNIINLNTCLNCGKDDAVLTVLAGTLNIAGEDEDEGALENSGKVIVEVGSTLNSNVYIRNNKTIDVNGTLNVLNLGDNYATINVAETGFVRVINNAILNNYNKAVIKVEGKLAENIKNSGEIFVINNGQVITNGIIAESPNGIIDVTDASGADNDAQKAMDYQVGNMGSHFRYTVKESTTATPLKEALEARISSRNINASFITIVFSANGEMTYAGKFDSSIKVYHVVVTDGTTLVLNKGKKTNITEFLTLSNTCGVDPAYKAFEVKKGATLIVADGAVLNLKENDQVWVNGTFKANDQSTLTGKAVVLGSGEFWMSTKNYDWTSTQFTGAKYGWK